MEMVFENDGEPCERGKKFFGSNGNVVTPLDGLRFMLFTFNNHKASLKIIFCLFMGVSGNAQVCVE